MKRARRRSPQQEIQRWRERRQKEWDERHPRFSSKGRLLSAEDKYNRGDKTEIMKELAWHLTTHENEPLPEWLRLALSDRQWRRKRAGRREEKSASLCGGSWNW